MTIVLTKPWICDMLSLISQKPSQLPWVQFCFGSWCSPDTRVFPKLLTVTVESRVCQLLSYCKNQYLWNLVFFNVFQNIFGFANDILTSFRCRCRTPAQRDDCVSETLCMEFKKAQESVGVFLSFFSHRSMKSFNISIFLPTPYLADLLLLLRRLWLRPCSYIQTYM